MLCTVWRTWRPCHHLFIHCTCTTLLKQRAENNDPVTCLRQQSYMWSYVCTGAIAEHKPCLSLRANVTRFTEESDKSTAKSVCCTAVAEKLKSRALCHPKSASHICLSPEDRKGGAEKKSDLIDRHLCRRHLLFLKSRPIRLDFFAPSALF